MMTESAGGRLAVLNEMMAKATLNDGDGQSREKPKRIKEIQFAMLSGPEMVQASELRVSNNKLYEIGSREPVEYGCLDPRLGVSDKSLTCKTCKKNLTNCTGHFGHIELTLPVFHIGYYKAIQSVLQTVCKSCGSVLLNRADKAKFMQLMQRPSADSIQKANTRKKIIETCKKARRCPDCLDFNGVVKKVPGADSIKLVHEKYKVKEFKDSDLAIRARQKQFRTAISATTSTELDEGAVDKIQESLSPLFVLNLFRKIRDEDLPLLWASPAHSRPENMILTHILVPPVAIRPSVKVESQGSNEDDLTGKLQEVIDCNNELAIVWNSGGKMKKVYEIWNRLQMFASQFINGELSGFPAQVRREQKAIRGLVQRLKGKQGRFRGNLSGKRVDFSGRTVISPDPNLEIHQVGVPTRMARKLTFPESVNQHNIERLRAAVRNGPDVHPGANAVRMMEDGNPGAGAGGILCSPSNAAAILENDSRTKKNLAYVRNRDALARELQIGDMVERHLRDDDIVLFNRQPSLHKMSIMSHRVKVLEGRSLRFNECVCAPYNADFDGDEMNLHVPQTDEARTEATMLMGVHENLITPRNGEPLITATQDFITSAFLMTRRNVFLTREQFLQVVTTIGNGIEHVDIPMPSILKPVPLWTGKQVWSVLLRPRFRSTEPGETEVLVNLETQERSYEGNDEDGPCMCPNEGYVIFRNSELICGCIGKGVLGGSKSGIIYVLVRDHAPIHAAHVMNRMTKVCTRWLTHYGFTIGLEDVTPDRELLKAKVVEIEAGESKCREFIEQFDNRTLQTKPGCNMEESLESEVSGVLSRVRDNAGKVCMQTLPKHNKPYIMATSGSKGSALNICQMMVCVGQQIVGGKRMPYGFVRRTLPHFHENAKGANARGFVKNSFFSGLSAPEFFFHTMGGREGLVDTAVKTAETGYMARRLMKALEDLSVAYDGSVRNAVNGIVQFNYGDDGLNPVCMEKGDRPVNWRRLEQHIKPTQPCRNESALTPQGLRDVRDRMYKDWRQVLRTTGAERDAGAASQFSESNSGVTFFVREMHDAIEAIATKLGKICASLGLDDACLADFGFVFPLSRDEDVHAHVSKTSGARSMETLRSAAPTRDEMLVCLNKLCRTTETQVHAIMRSAVRRFMKAMTEPGEAVGAIGAQSLGEPGTQMTLKTFHFAGVASMNVTLGVPRIKEIINASKNISTPIITVKLARDNDERVARVVQGRIESTRLGDIAAYIEEQYSAEECAIKIKLASEAINRLHLDVSAESVKRAINECKAIRLRDGNKSLQTQVHVGSDFIRVVVDSKHRIAAGRTSATTADPSGHDAIDASVREDLPLVFNMQAMKRALRTVIVNGIPSVHRAVVNHEGDDNNRYELLVEGLGLQEVLATPGVDGTRTITNHVMEMEEVLGIEAARELVQKEVAYIFGQYGLSIDKRHLMLLADVMSYRGSILGITRFGIAKMKESVLMLASFEKTADHLFDAAAHSRRDEINGVSECIIMGTPIPLGTGMFKLLGQWEGSAAPAPKPLRIRERSLLDF
ncbi:DNA-directed RNA polymerase subunit [Hondaea fermentalgiana]|uniref:DNA-directed RNA polymerase subunit n=1 Tax=Hondaea fermentalgiana TaxID=2315210 RepID=A0A2R5GNW9_9STRA|nr:DNA-directed RNA polymerase subunit [Hondaea fermentalgiana]|eukprot:GBG32582.1 DNA-directed RNA polymerase subunit [Hondaea fermentalgiana]